MIIKEIKELTPNHIGIVISQKFKETILEEKRGEFVEDPIQGVEVCFIWDEEMQIYKEFITQEGRARNYKIGYNHICFDIDTKTELQSFHKQLIKSKLGIRLTLPEPSPTKQCNIVSFYKIKGLGIVEFNILES